MSIALGTEPSPHIPRAYRIWFDDENLLVALFDSRQLRVPLAEFPRLLKASPEQRNQYEISGGGTGLHRDALGEDISVPGLLGWT
jgi:hypothetical protein